ncbi:MAG: twin-arginine translocase TatA/TatE family subunit [Planctomycetes bacterium]|nr:twin-arginine translocase TatA/TatE family subunit [Planctomycetota bacterium]
MALGLIGTLGSGELLIILFLALMMFGGRLPEVARSLGKSVNQFKRGLKDFDTGVSGDDPPSYRPPTRRPESLTAPIAAASTEAARAAPETPAALDATTSSGAAELGTSAPKDG